MTAPPLPALPRSVETVRNRAIRESICKLPEPSSDVLDLEIVTLAVDDALDVGEVLRAASNCLMNDEIFS